MSASSVKVTVYVPSHNYGRYLTQAVESVLSQLHRNWELFIVDDGSTDETAIVAETLRLRDSGRIQVISYSTPVGLQRLANDVLARATGKYIVRLDADDWFDEAALLLMTAKLESDSDLGIVYGNYFYVNEAGEVLGSERRRVLNVEDVGRHLPPHGACTMVRTRLLRVVGGYSEGVNAQDGWELWLKLMQRARAASLTAPLFYYRQHQQSLSRDDSRLLRARMRILEQTRHQFTGDYRPSVLAVVPVHESFPGFPDVPYAEIGGCSLLERALRSAQEASCVTDVALSTDSQRVLEFGRDLGKAGRVGPFTEVLRTGSLSGARVQVREILSHAVATHLARSGREPDIVMFLSIHAPFRRAAHVDAAIDVLRLHASDSVVSVTSEVEPVFAEGRSGLRLLNPGRFKDLTLERERLYRFNGAILAMWTETLKDEAILGEKVGHLEMTQADSQQVKQAADVAVLQLREGLLKDEQRESERQLGE